MGLHWISYLRSPRLLAVLMLGFASGLPLALVGSTLQAWFTAANVSLMAIGVLTLLQLPYTLKFLWAPLMDYYSPLRYGKRKGWILLMQIGLIATLLWLSFGSPVQQPWMMGVVALLVAFFSASQDISITAYQTDVLTPDERGLGAASYIFGYRMAVLVSGGLALIFADQIGWRLTYQCMAALFLLTMIATYFSPAPKEYPLPTSDLYGTVKAALNDLWQREHIILILCFIAFYKFGDALALSLMTTFLLKGLGFTLTEVGVAYKVVSIVAVILGGFVGGMYLTRWSLPKALVIFGSAQAASNLLFAVLAGVGKSFSLMMTAIFVENFCSGLSTAALLAFMMGLCHHQFTASQFALLSTFASLGRVYFGPIAAILVAHLGWVNFFVLTTIICVPGIVLVGWIKEKVNAHDTPLPVV